jgi:hypothetical protein
MSSAAWIWGLTLRSEPGTVLVESAIGIVTILKRFFLLEAHELERKEEQAKASWAKVYVK